MWQVQRRVETSATFHIQLEEGGVSEGQQETRLAKPNLSVLNGCTTQQRIAYNSAVHSHVIQQLAAIRHSSTQPYGTALSRT